MSHASPPSTLLPTTIRTVAAWAVTLLLFFPLGWLFLTAFKTELQAIAVPPLFVLGVLLYLLAVTFHYILLSLESSQAAERREMEARVLARAAGFAGSVARLARGDQTQRRATAAGPDSCPLAAAAGLFRARHGCQVQDAAARHRHRIGEKA